MKVLVTLVNIVKSRGIIKIQHIISILVENFKQKGKLKKRG